MTLHRVLLTIGCIGLLAVLAAGCKEEAQAPAATTSEQAVQYANVRCPIMGSQLDLANVPEQLRRRYKGQNVAFCCAGCPRKWDTLSDAEKDAKLAAAK